MNLEKVEREETLRVRAGDFLEVFLGFIVLVKMPLGVKCSRNRYGENCFNGGKNCFSSGENSSDDEKTGLTTGETPPTMKEMV